MGAIMDCEFLGTARLGKRRLRRSLFSCENAVLWRGHFKATGEEKSVNLSINGGTAFAASVWLNDVFLGTSFGE